MRSLLLCLIADLDTASFYRAGTKLFTSSLKELQVVITLIKFQKAFSYSRMLTTWRCRACRVVDFKLPYTKSRHTLLCVKPFTDKGKLLDMDDVIYYRYYHYEFE